MAAGGGDVNRPIVFLDTETTGLDPEDEVWEYAAIRREVDGSERSMHLFLQHDTARCFRLPESFRADHLRRFPTSGTAEWHPNALDPGTAAATMHPWFRGRPTIVGAVPSFDTERIAALLRRHGFEPTWHHRLRCVETLTAGHLGRDVGGLGDCATALDIAAPAAHTAMGDTETARAIWDRVMAA